MNKTVTDDEIYDDFPSIALISFVTEFTEAIEKRDMEKAAIAIRNCVVLSYAEQIKPLEYKSSDE